jgi:hypothetical protein
MIQAAPTKAARHDYRLTVMRVGIMVPFSFRDNDSAISVWAADFAGRPGAFDHPCQNCKPARRSAANSTRKVLRVWHEQCGLICFRCGLSGTEREHTSTGEQSTRGLPRRPPWNKARTMSGRPLGYGPSTRY